MRDVAVTGLPLVVVLAPLLQLTTSADLHLRETGKRRPNLGGEVLVATEKFRRDEKTLEETHDDLRVSGRAHAEAGAKAVLVEIVVLRRDRGAEDELSRRRILDQEVEHEACSLLHPWIRAIAKEAPRRA